MSYALHVSSRIAPPDGPRNFDATLAERLEPDRDISAPVHDENVNLSEWDEAGAVRGAANREIHLDLVQLGATRFSGIALASAIAFGLYGIPAYLASLHAGVEGKSLSASVIALLVGLCVSLLVYVPTKLRMMRAELVHGLCYVHLFATCLTLGVFRHLEPTGSGPLLHHASPVIIPILAYAALIPALPRTAGLALFGAAAMDPLGMFLTHGHTTSPAPMEWVLAAASPLVAAFLGLKVSEVVHRLNVSMVKAREIGSYRLVERLGVGGMAEVWRADHKMLARPAAVKIVRPEVLIAHGSDMSQRLLRHFVREARTTARLNSPHTIQIYDFGVTREGAFYYVMELLDGVDLQRLVERFGPQPSERVAHVLMQMCHSLDEAHARNFVHRDIKPANVYLCHHGEDYDFVKILDFGLVLDRHPTTEEIDDEQRQVGTPAVMAPEMVRFQAPVDARADLYAVGCVAYWLLTGQRVFEAQNRHDMLIMHAHQKPIAPSRRVALEVHPGLERVVMGCLEKNPAKRPQCARDLANELASLSFDPPWAIDRAESWWKRMRPTAVAPSA